MTAGSNAGASGRGRRLRRRLALGLLVGAVAAGVVLALGGTYPLRVAELKTYDARVRGLADRSRADTSIVILAVDDRSLGYVSDRIGRWPWPRDVYANIVDYLAAAGARLALFDIGLYEPDLERPAADSVFAAAIESSGIIVLPVAFGRSDDTAAVRRLERYLGREAGQALLPRFALDGAGDLPPALSYQTVQLPPALLGQGARALGSISFDPSGEDGLSRAERLVYGYRGGLYPSLALAAARALDPERFGGEASLGEAGLRLGDERIPLDDGRLLIRWRGPFLDNGRPTYPIYPSFGVLNSYEQVSTGQTPDVPLEALRDKIVVVGATAAGLLDLRATPFGAREPGLLVHATILDNLLRGDYLRRAPAWANLGLTAATALVGGAVVAAAGSALVASLGALLVLLLAGAAASLAFLQGMWLDMAAPLFAGALAFAGAMAVNYVTEGRDRKRVRDLFSRYVSPEYVRQLADDYQALRLGGERVPLTLLFSDIRGFTSISEKLPAETVVGMLNEYLDKMAEVVFRHGGTLDKFIGDAVMAFWGAPVPVEDHARRAVETALDMQDELEKLNRKWEAQGALARLSIGIGINTGEAVVGNIGSLSHKLDYTAIGDAVNLASRLEGLNKEYGTTLIVSETTWAALADGFEGRVLDEVRVKGKEQSVRIYEVLGRRRARAQTPAVALPLLAFLLSGLLPGDLAAQTRARWTDKVYHPGIWQSGRLVSQRTRNEATDSLALVAVVETYSVPPRWRVEVRRVEEGGKLRDPLVVVADRTAISVLTPVGSTALAKHAAANDPLVQAIVGRFDAQGRPQATGSARFVDRDRSGDIERIVLRMKQARSDFPDHLLATGTASRLGRNLLKVSMQEIGASRSQEVVATAGARGVAKVRTLDGEITVMPDTAGIVRLEGLSINVIELDRFLREGKLGPHAVAAGKEGTR